MSHVNSLVVDIYRKDAIRVLNILIEKKAIKKNEKGYLISNERNNHISSTQHKVNINRLETLRTLATDLNSPEDMFLGSNFSLTKESKLELMVFLKQLHIKQHQKLADKELSDYTTIPTRIDINCWSLDFSDLLFKDEERLLQ